MSTAQTEVELAQRAATSSGNGRRTGARKDFRASDLEIIAARAATISERVEAVRASGEVAPPKRANLEPWVKAFSPGDRAAFRRRVSWDGWTESELERALGEDSAGGSAPATAWIETLGRAAAWFAGVADELGARGRLPEESYFEPAHPPPFLELCCPFLRAGREALGPAPAGGTARLEPEAQSALERQLLDDLAFQSALAFQEAFSLYRAGSGYPGEAPRPQSRSDPGASPDVRDRAIRTDPAGAGSRRLYGAFVDQMLRAGLVDFFLTYSLLARQLCRLVETWVASTREFLTRLDSHWSELERYFGEGVALGSVVTAEPGLSDRHRGGRQVLALRFASGARLVYKPRSVALDAAFSRFLLWLAEGGLTPAPRSPLVLERDGFGWVGFIETSAAASASQVEEHYRQAGALLCLAYVLRGDDLCAENIVATAEGPVIVDCENFIQPRIDAGGGPNGTDRNVLQSQLLSSVQIDPTGAPYDSGGLEGRGGSIAEIRRRVWRFPNTDAMFCEHRVATTEPGANALYRDGIAQETAEHAEALIRGFEKTYRLLLRRRSELLDGDGPLTAFAACPTRILFRPSNSYAVLLHCLRQPRYQRRSVPGSFLIDAMSRACSTDTERPKVWPLIKQERSELEGLDIPHFTVPTDQRVVHAGGEEVDDFASLSGFDAVRLQITRLSEEDLSEQLRLIREVSAELRLPLSSGAWAAERRLAPAEALRETFLERAVEIGERLRQRAQETAAGEGPGSTAWLRPDFAGDVPLSLNLYDGAAGVALFLAALAHATQDSAHAELARSAAAAVTAALDDGDAASGGGQLGTGACTGLGGVIYSLAAIGRLLGEPTYLDRARRVAALIGTERIAAEPTADVADVADGLAGTILGVLGLHDHRPEPELLELAGACCDRLLALRDGSGHDAAWPIRGRVLGGFAHGSAGIACALARSHQATGGAGLLGEAVAAFAAAERYFARPPSDWPAGLSLTWCQGTPGLALGRLAAWDVLADRVALKGIDSVLRSAAGWQAGGVDHLCCGNFGRADLLVEAWLVLERRDCLRQAAALASRVLDRAAADGGFRLDDGVADCYDPGFFRGLSGIGYTLLRLARPGAFPSVLALRRIP